MDNETNWRELQAVLTQASPTVFSGFLLKLQSNAWIEGYTAAEQPDAFNPYVLLMGEDNG